MIFLKKHNNCIKVGLFFAYMRGQRK